MNNPNDQGMHPDDKRNLFIFMLLAIAIYFTFDHFILRPKMEAIQAQEKAKLEAQQELQRDAPQINISAAGIRAREEVISDHARLPLENEKMRGSINLSGGRIDDIRLKEHYKTLDKEDHVEVLTPSGVLHARFAEFGWVASLEDVQVPGADTVWQAPGNARLTPDSPVTLSWENGQGFRFERTYSLDEDYLITISQQVVNSSDKSVTFYPYALISQRGLPEDYAGRYIVHEGPIGYINEELMEKSYKDLRKKGTVEAKSKTGWIGATEKYWLVSILPEQQKEKTFRFVYTPSVNTGVDDLYQIDTVGPGLVVKAGETISYQSNLFAGAKELDVLTAYEEELSVRHLDLAIDFGLFYFLTRPLFIFLNYLYDMVGNFGIAIIILTVILRIAVFPLANTSFRSFANMKRIAPQMQELREKYGEDKAKLQEELVSLYQREKVNPMSGCLPILIQIPIFFALYKVLSINIEMRHAPFFGWIQDLSARDPTSVFNLFGLLPFTPPSVLQIGVWPCLLLLALLSHRVMSPPAQDKTQAFVIKYLPYMMAFIMSKFAAGLVIYWTFSSAFSTIQQYVIMRRMGVEIHFFGKTKSERRLEKQVKEGPTVHPGLEMVEDQVEDAMFGEPGTDDEKPEQKPVSKPKPKKKKKK